MEITSLGYFTKRAQAAHTQQLGLLGGGDGPQFFRLLHKDTKTPHPTQSWDEKGTQTSFAKTENREIHILSKVSTMTITHPLGDKHVFVGSKTKLSIEKPLSRDD